MKHVSILIPQGHSSLVNIEGTHQILSWVNIFLKEMGREPLFDLHLVGLSYETRQATGLFTVNPDGLIHEIRKTDLIIIPAIHGPMEVVRAQNAAFIPWIIDQYERGAEVASFCVGAFFLASTGLLNGKQCATHWRMAQQFRSAFPEAILVDDKIMTASDRIYTSGGAYSYLNLLLYLVEKHAGREIAVLIAKTFMIDIDRHSQSPFIMFTGQKNHDDEDIIKAQEYIEKNYAEKISVDELCRIFPIGRRSLERRFKKATANTVTEYIQRVKMEAAKKQLESGRKTVNEVMYEVSYTDTKAFRDVFKRLTGMTPVEYRNKYNKAAVA